MDVVRRSLQRFHRHDITILAPAGLPEVAFDQAELYFIRRIPDLLHGRRRAVLRLEERDDSYGPATHARGDLTPTTILEKAIHRQSPGDGFSGLPLPPMVAFLAASGTIYFSAALS